MEPESQNRSYLIETNKVTMDPSRNPGFCFLVDPPNDKPYQIYSIHYLPQKPESLKGEFKRYNLAKATQGIKTIEKHVKGIRSFCFDFHAGDPLGNYQIKIFINKILNSIVELEAISIKNPLTKELQ